MEEMNDNVSDPIACFPFFSVIPSETERSGVESRNLLLRLHDAATRRRFLDFVLLTTLGALRSE
jgi:hypothetical protein